MANEVDRSLGRIHISEASPYEWYASAKMQNSSHVDSLGHGAPSTALLPRGECAKATEQMRQRCKKAEAKSKSRKGDTRLRGESPAAVMILPFSDSRGHCPTTVRNDTREIAARCKLMHLVWF